MRTFVILARFVPGAYQHPREITDLASRVKEAVKKECKGVEWKGSYSTLGRYDVVDIIEAADDRAAARAAMIIAAVGHCTTETLSATAWKDFLAAL